MIKRRKMAIIVFALLISVMVGSITEAAALSSSTEPPSVVLAPDRQALISGSALLWKGGDGVYFIDDFNSLYRWVIGMPTVETVQDDIFEKTSDEIDLGQLRAAELFVSENTLYAFSAAEGIFYRYTADGWAVLARFDPDDAMLSTLSLNSARDFVIEQERMFFTARTNGLSEYRSIVCIDVTNGECLVITLGHVQAIAAYRPGYLLVQTDGVIRDVRIGDTQAIGNIVISADSPDMLTSTANPVTFAYDAQLDQIIFMKEGDLYVQRSDALPAALRALPKRYGSYGEEDKEPYPLYPSGISQILPLSEDLIAIDMGKVYIATYAPLTQAIESLRASLRSYDADLFSLAHPHVSVEEWMCFYRDAVDPSERYNPKYPLDVYETSTDEGLPFLMCNGYAMDITDIQEIASKVSTFYPQVQGALSHEGRIMAVPTAMFISLWTYQADLWKMLDLPELPKTMEEFWDLYSLWGEKYAKVYPGVSFTGSYSDGVLETMVIPIKDQYIFQHATGKEPVNFDTPQFRMLIERMRELPDVEMSSSAPYLNPMITYSQDSRSPFYDLEYWGTDGYMPLVPPMLPGQSEPCIGAILYALYASADTPNPSLAQEFLTFAAEHTRRGLPIMLSATENEPLPMAAGMVDRLWQTFEWDATSHIREGDEHQRLLDNLYAVAFLQKEPYIISPKTISFYRNVAPFITFQTDALGGNNRMERTYEVFDLLFAEHILNDPSNADKFGDSLFASIPINKSVANALFLRSVTDDEAFVSFLNAAADAYFKLLH